MSMNNAFKIIIVNLAGSEYVNILIHAFLTS